MSAGNKSILLIKQIIVLGIPRLNRQNIALDHAIIMAMEIGVYSPYGGQMRSDPCDGFVPEDSQINAIAHGVTC